MLTIQFIFFFFSSLLFSYLSHCVVWSFTSHHKNQITLLSNHSSGYQYIYRKPKYFASILPMSISCMYQCKSHNSRVNIKAHKHLCAECEIVCQQIKSIWFSNFKCWPNEWTFEFKRQLIVKFKAWVHNTIFMKQIKKRRRRRRRKRKMR